MATIKEIAEKAGVSIGTVDRVLHNRGMVNAQTKERVETVMKELNYRPNQVAQGLAVMKKKLKIGFLFLVRNTIPISSMWPGRHRRRRRSWRNTVCR